MARLITVAVGLFLAITVILAIRNEGYRDGLAVGQRRGFEHGRETGYSDGFTAGLESGRRNGERVGYRQGYTDAKWGRRNRAEDAEWLIIDANRDRPKAIAMEIVAIFAVPFLCYCLAGLYLGTTFFGLMLPDQSLNASLRQGWYTARVTALSRQQLGAMGLASLSTLLVVALLLPSQALARASSFLCDAIRLEVLAESVVVGFGAVAGAVLAWGIERAVSSYKAKTFQIGRIAFAAAIPGTLYQLMTSIVLGHRASAELGIKILAIPAGLALGLIVFVCFRHSQDTGDRQPVLDVQDEPPILRRRRRRLER